MYFRPIYSHIQGIFDTFQRSKMPDACPGGEICAVFCCPICCLLSSRWAASGRFSLLFAVSKHCFQKCGEGREAIYIAGGRTF